jgi:hypothetical protein
MIRKALGIIMGGVLALAFISFAPNARADERDQAVQFTFNQPVEIPGNHVLPAGTYWFVMLDAGSHGRIVQVFNTDRSQLFATLETITTERPNITDQTQLTFGKVSPDKPLMLIDWFYPGLTAGHEFVYSSQQESQISEGNRITLIAQSGKQVSAG